MQIHLPEKHNKKWFIFLPLMTVVLTIVISLLYFLIIKQGLTVKNAAGFLIISFSISLITFIPGYFGSNIIFFSALISSILGILYGAYIFSTNLNGFESVVGLLDFIIIFLIGTAFGILIELIKFFINRFKNKK